MRGLTLWELWQDKNSRCFHNETWPLSKIIGNIWDGLQDYGRIAWRNTCMKAPSDNYNRIDKFKSFDTKWGSNKILCIRDNMTIR
jgi:hypothetical protein